MLESLKIIDEKIGQFKYGYLDITLVELEQIKQDLEVLEIIRKKKVNVHLVIMSLNNCSGNVEAALIYHNDYKGGFYDEYLTIEELLKLQKFLESNKVGASNE